jgi:hypothetical protein
MQRWLNYFLWCIVVGMLAGIEYSTYSIAALIADYCAIFCACAHNRIAVKGVIK